MDSIIANKYGILFYENVYGQTNTNKGEATISCQNQDLGICRMRISLKSEVPMVENPANHKIRRILILTK